MPDNVVFRFSKLGHFLKQKIGKSRGPVNFYARFSPKVIGGHKVLLYYKMKQANEVLTILKLVKQGNNPS